MNKRPAWWLLPNLLSLDAPIVAVAWMWILAKSMRVMYVESSSYWLVASAVWCVYAMDRIFDVWGVKKAENKNEAVPVVHLSPRHYFHWKYRYFFIAVAVCLIIWSIYVSLNIASENLLTAGCSGIFMVLLYLLVRKLDLGNITYFKNAVAALTFAFGVSAPIVLERMDLYHDPHVMSLTGVYYQFTEESQTPLAVAMQNAAINTVKMTVSSLGVVIFQSFLPLLFALLCFLNITAIDVWQKSRDTDDEEEKQYYETIVGVGLISLVALSVYLGEFRFSESERMFAYMVMVSAALLQVLNRSRSRFYLDAQRVLADFFMILPLPIVWFLFK